MYCKSNPAIRICDVEMLMSKNTKKVKWAVAPLCIKHMLTFTSTGTSNQMDKRSRKKSLQNSPVNYTGKEMAN